MKLEAFAMERLQSEWENRVAHNLSESGVHPLNVAELLEGSDSGIEALLSQRLVYIQSNGTAELRARIAALHPGAGPEHVTVANGGAEANFIAAWRVVEPGDEHEADPPSPARAGADSFLGGAPGQGART